MLMDLGFVIDAMVFVKHVLVSTTVSPVKQALLIVVTATAHAQQVHIPLKQLKLASLVNHLVFNVHPLRPFARSVKIIFCHI